MRPTFQTNFTTTPPFFNNNSFLRRGLPILQFRNSEFLLIVFLDNKVCLCFLLTYQFAESNCPAILNPTPACIPFCIVPVCPVCVVTWELIFLDWSPFEKHLYPSRCLVQGWAVLTELAKHIQSILSQSTLILLPKEKSVCKIKLVEFRLMTSLLFIGRGELLYKYNLKNNNINTCSFFTKVLWCARCCVKHFIYTIYVSPYNNPLCMFFFPPAERKFHTGKYCTLLFIVASLVPRTVPGIEQTPNHICQIMNGYLFSDRETEAQRGQL